MTRLKLEFRAKQASCPRACGQASALARGRIRTPDDQLLRTHAYFASVQRRVASGTSILEFVCTRNYARLFAVGLPWVRSLPGRGYQVPFKHTYPSRTSLAAPGNHFGVLCRVVAQAIARDRRKKLRGPAIVGGNPRLADVFANFVDGRRERICSMQTAFSRSFSR
jgi:hypothetical protein